MATEQLELAIPHENIHHIELAATPTHRFWERVFWLASTDTGIVLASFLAALLLRLKLDAEFQLSFAGQSAGEIGSWFLLFGALWLVVAFPLGCYNVARATSLHLSLQRTSKAMLIAYLIYFTIPYATPPLPTKRIQVVLFPLLGIAGLAAWRLLYVTLFTQLNTFKQRALILGANEVGAGLVQDLNSVSLASRKLASLHNYHIVGFVDNCSTDLPQAIAGVPILGTGRDLVRLAEQHQVDELILTEPNSSKLDSETFEAMLKCRERGILIKRVARLYEQLPLPVKYAGPDCSVALPLGKPVTFRPYFSIERSVNRFDKPDEEMKP